MTRAEAIATAKAALRAVARGLGRFAVYLGPLILAALAYIFRLVVDAVQGARVLSLRRRKRKAPERAAEFEPIEQKLRDTKASRWAAWHALPARRRVAVRTAAVLLALLAFVAARAAWLPAPKSAATSSTTAANEAGSASSASGGASDVPPTTNIRQAAAQFAADRLRIAPGEWALLYDPPVLEPGRLGAWDDFRVGSPIVMKEDAGGVFGRGRQYRMWYLGCHLAMGEHTCGIGHAVSADGIIWEKHPQAVFVPADPIVQDNLYEISVVKAGGRYWLWYSVAADHFAGRPRATVNLATSPDGLVWTEQGQVLEGESSNTLIIEHSVFHDGQSFHLWYVTPIEGVGSRVLQHLSSADGKAWTVVGGTPLESLKQSLEPFGRLMVETGASGGFRALFTFATGAQHLGDMGVMGVMVSPDGTTWHMQAMNWDPFTALGRRIDVRAGTLTGTNERDGLWLWITIVGHRHDEHVAVAFRKGS